MVIFKYLNRKLYFVNIIYNYIYIFINKFKFYLHNYIYFLICWFNKDIIFKTGVNIYIYIYIYIALNIALIHYLCKISNIFGII